MMGAGKSVVGAALARRTGYRFVDLDREIERAAGRPVAEIFAEEGEASFRATEEKLLHELLGGTEDLVLSAGGGVVLSAANRRVLHDGATVVWLRARPDTLVERLGDGRGRPLLAGPDLASRICDLDAQRRDHYEAVADVVVDVDDLSPAEIVRTITRQRAAGATETAR